MLHRFRVLQILLFLVLVSCFSISAEAQRRRNRFRQQAPSSTALECRVFCSDEKLRTPVAELTWRSTQALLSAVRIEVTVYKDGFKTGAYASLDSNQGNRSYQSQKGRGGQDLIPGLSQLVVVDVRSLRERPGLVAVRIEGLEPGLNYFWRVVSKANGRQMAGVTARCQAPVCPADMQPNQKP